MKPDYLLDALSSIAEVAIFAWSLLELLLTRILPLVGFLVGYLLLQFGSLLSSAIHPRAAEAPAAENSYSRDDQQQSSYYWDDQPQSVEEEFIEEEEPEQKLQVEEAYGNYQGISERLTSANTDDEAAGIIPREKASVLPSLTEAEAVALTADAAVHQNVELLDSASREPHVADRHDAAAEGGRRVRDGGESIRGDVLEPSRLDGQQFALQPSDTGSEIVDVVAVRHVSPKPEVVEGQFRHVSPKAENSAGSVDLEPSDGQRSEPSGTVGSVELQKSSSRRRRPRRIGVLPPSLSQVRRTVMQRSRRGTPSPHTSSPVNVLAPSPSPIQKKQPHGRRRKTSPALRSSLSYNSFVRRFREHFLLDPV